ncbi:MAG: hypothetical protein J2P37_35580, partial [Ktedonobacteraceae bacterium]|nr:hypothetical protein [Ktedonobacteraceae bacterium]
SDPGDWTGYLGQKTTGPSGRGDDFERLAISPASTEGKAGTHISRLFADHPQLSDLLTENMDSMISICREANNSLSDMLKISKADSDHLWFSSHSSKLVLNYYPVSEPVPLAAHTDFGGLTLVYSGNNPSALEIEDPGTNTWHSVRNLSNETALITMGELYSYWVGQLWPPTVHRVASPYPGRISVILFHIPARDQYITPIRGRSPRVWADSFIANREHGYLIR